MAEHAWRRATDVPLMVAAVVFLAAYSWQVLGDPHGGAAVAVELIVDFTWVLFAVDYVVSLILAPNRWRWFTRHLIDLAAIVLPALRPLRLLRFVSLLGMLRRASGAAVRGRVVVFVVGATALLAYAASLAILDAERGAADARITDFGTAVWWVFATMTTVGYGDVYPVTVLGRVIAVGVMIGGIALLGVVTATLASWIVQRVAAADEEVETVTRAEVRELRAEIAALRAALHSPDSHHRPSE